MSQYMISERASQQVFFGVSALLFALSTTLTIIGCASMSTMGSMAMPGGWTMSMAWMRMPEQTWLGAATTFVSMWIVMMVAMMLPSLTPMLSRYRDSISRTSGLHQGRLTVLVGAGYFFVWTLFGIAIFPLGVALATIAMQFPAFAQVVPITIGVIALIAGALQFTEWKKHHLACCREKSARTQILAASANTAWNYGLRLGLHCCYCCAGMTVILLVIGVMDLRAMIAVTIALTAERLTPAGERVARMIGVLIIAWGVFLILRAVAS